MDKIISILLSFLFFSLAPVQADTTYDHIINHHAERTGVPFALIKAVIKAESSFNPVVVSHKGAQGLMQLMPMTAQRWKVNRAFDPNDNIKGGTTYLKWLYERFGDWRLALAGYNAGEGTIDKYGGIPPYKETQKYVRKVMKDWHQFSGGKSPITMKQPDLDTQPEATPLTIRISPGREKNGGYQLFEGALQASMVVEWPD